MGGGGGGHTRVPKSIIEATWEKKKLEGIPQSKKKNTPRSAREKKHDWRTGCSGRGSVEKQKKIFRESLCQRGGSPFGEGNRLKDGSLKGIPKKKYRREDNSGRGTRKKGYPRRNREADKPSQGNI